MPHLLTSPALVAELTTVAQQAAQAPHGQRGAVYRAACDRLGLALPTLHRHLQQVGIRPLRKQRSDAGSMALSIADARVLSAVMMEGFRNNDKKLQSVKGALLRLRANLVGFACVVAAETGELAPISESACARALRHYALHPDQLRQPTAAQTLRSRHPNHVWEIDASISTLYYVPEGDAVQDMSPAEFYKNKPQNFERIKRERLTRYCVTDHCSGSIFVLYVPGGESTDNLVRAFLAATQQRSGHEMYGVPFIVFCDPGSAAMSGAFGALMRRLRVKVIAHKARNARATGAVEKSHDIVECDFESGFKLAHVPSLDWINEKAMQWMRWFHTEVAHSRYGYARWLKWREIKTDQLRLAPSLEICQKLIHKGAATPTVNDKLQVRFDGRVWDVRSVPGVLIGQKVQISLNPYQADAAWIAEVDAEGHETLIEVPEVRADEHGFADTGPVIGEEFKALPQTRADINRQLVEQIATGTDSAEAAAKARKAKVVPFGGQIDPYRHHSNVSEAVALPKRGTDLIPAATVAVAQARVLSHFEVARALVGMGVALDGARHALIKQLHPDGVPETEVEALAARIRSMSALLVITGGAK